MLASFDATILLALNHFARRSWAFDEFVADILMLPSVKLLPLVACLVWLWFRHDEREGSRLAVIQALIGGFVALVVSRLIQDFSPDRPRPIYDEALGFIRPYGVSADILRDWSSFPSDTTAMAFALASGVFLASRRLGWFCFAWAALVAALPRAYLGYHYPSDLLGGAALGTLIVLLCGRAGVPQRIGRALSLTEQRWPALFYGFGFVVLFQLTVMFDDLREMARGLAKVAPMLL
jgi:membrane-associated phospholipid phosphatase